MPLVGELVEHLTRAERMVDMLGEHGAPLAIEELRRGREKLERLLELAQIHAEWEIQARAAHVLGALDYRLGPWGSAGTLLRGASIAAGRPGVNPGVLAATARLLAELELHLCGPERACCYSHLSLALARIADNRRAATDALLQLAVVDIQLGAFQGAEQRLEEAQVDIAPEDVSALAKLFQIRAKLREKDGRMEEALELEQKALEHWRAAEKPGGEASALMRMGYYHLSPGQQAMAMERFQAAYSLAREIVHPFIAAAALYGLAWAYNAAGDSPMAIESALRAEFIYRALGSPLANEPYDTLLKAAGVPQGAPGRDAFRLSKRGWHEILY